MTSRQSLVFTANCVNSRSILCVIKSRCDISRNTCHIGYFKVSRLSWIFYAIEFIQRKKHTLAVCFSRQIFIPIKQKEIQILAFVFICLIGENSATGKKLNSKLHSNFDFSDITSSIGASWRFLFFLTCLMAIRKQSTNSKTNDKMFIIRI